MQRNTTTGEIVTHYSQMTPGVDYQNYGGPVYKCPNCDRQWSSPHCGQCKTYAIAPHALSVTDRAFNAMPFTNLDDILNLWPAGVYVKEIHGSRGCTTVVETKGMYDAS